MIILTAILLFFLALLLWILFAPVHVYVNTWEELAYIELYGLMRFIFVWKDYKPLFRMRIFFLEFNLPSGKKKPKKPRKPKKRKRSFSASAMLEAGRALLKTFRLEKLRLRMDTGDVADNARLVPLFCLINTHPAADCAVSFNGELGMECLIGNRISRMLPVFFKMRKTLF
jgi:hypothetical protein